MKPSQLARFAVGGLWRQKVRTALTLVGVTVGTCALAFSLSLGLGLRSFIDNEFKSRDSFWRVAVRVADPAPDPAGIPPEAIAVPGFMSDARKARIRDALIEKHVRAAPVTKPAVELTPAAVAAIAALPDVAEVRTYRTSDGRLWRGETAATTFVVAGPLTGLTDQLVQGRLPAADAAEMAVAEFTLYELGVRDDAAFDAVIGTKLPLDVGGVRNTQAVSLARTLTGRFQTDELSRVQSAALEKLTAALPQKLDAFDLTPQERAGLKVLMDAKPAAKERPWESGTTVRGAFAVSGVLRRLTREERKDLSGMSAWETQRGEVFLPAAAGERLLGELPWMKDAGFFSAEVVVTPGGDLPGVVAGIERLGFETHSSLRWFTNAKREVTMIAGGLNLFALVALFVAGIGITNTLVTTVVERTREIGILKAVGATRGQVQGIFLAEGTAIGLAGAALGLGLARVLAVPADTWIHALIQKQTNGEPLVTQTVFTFPWWLWAGGAAFAVVVTTAAAYYPARRAARIHPIEALRYG